MKDYEKVREFERQLFFAKETKNFLKASLNALDKGLEEKLATVEKIKEDYDKKALRLQNSLSRIEGEISTLEQKLGIAQQTEKDNVRLKKSQKKRVKKPQPPKKKEPEPAFIAPEPIKKEEEITTTIEEPTPEETKNVVENITPQEVEKDENGKKTCPLCGEQFSPQGFSSHLRSCLDKQGEE